MEFLRGALNWFGNFAGGIFREVQHKVFIHTGRVGTLGWIMFFFKKWYVIVIVPAVVSLYWVIKGLHDIGLLQDIENFVSYHLAMVVDIARYCTPLILKQGAFWECLNDPGGH